MKKNTILKDTIHITVITLVAGFALGLVNEITKEPIAHQEELAKQEACQAVFAEADDFTETIDISNAPAILEEAGLAGLADINEALVAKSGGESVGVVVTVTDHEGYGGDIRFTVGISNEGVVTGISILSIDETAGLGMKADTDEFKSQFVGMSAEQPIAYTKTGEEGKIDAISGATVTTNAMVNGANAAIALYNSIQ